VNPYWKNDAITLYCGDCREVLRELPDKSVHCVITSPPYWGLRDYGVDGQLGLESTLELYVQHLVEVFREVWRVLRDDGTLWLNLGSSYASGDRNPSQSRPVQREPACGSDGKERRGLPMTDPACSHCGGECPADFQSHQCHISRSDQRPHGGVEHPCKTDHDNGLVGSVQASPDVSARGAQASTKPSSCDCGLDACGHATMASVCQKGSQTSVGDVPLSACMGQNTHDMSSTSQPSVDRTQDMESFFSASDLPPGSMSHDYTTMFHGVKFKPKDLIPIPWMVAMALQADGWWLRSDIIWRKVNCMPSNVRDRPTTSHEYVFLLAKSRKYYYDQDAIREPHPLGRNKRTVWAIPTRPYHGAHYAVFPPDLVEPMILAGTSAKGCCPKCGAPWERIVTKGELIQQHWAPGTQKKINKVWGKYGESSVMATGFIRPNITIGWRPTCRCSGLTLIEDPPRPPYTDDPYEETIYTLRMNKWLEYWEGFVGDGLRSLYEAEPKDPCVVLDPFAGSGTVGEVAIKHNRRAILIELSETYCRIDPS